MDIRSRLEALRQTVLEKELHGPRDRQKPAPKFLEEWERLGEYTYGRTARYPLKGAFWNDLAEAMRVFLPPAQRQVLCFDLETTGLSGGAGTLVFLFGWARAYPDEVVLEQYFVSDFPGEGEFLGVLADRVPFLPELRFLSYNGVAYDGPLLKTRYLMNRRQPPELSQVDLLYLVRRLWKKSLPDCSLRTVEQWVLGKERTGDPPGRLVPEIYFSYLKTGELDGIRTVFKHNEEDLRSLLEVFALMGSMLREQAPQAGADPLSLALLAMDYQVPWGWDYLEQLARKGNPVALERVSQRYRREGKGERAESVRAPYLKELYAAALEEMKHLEHARKAYVPALELARFWLGKALPPPCREALLRRAERLERKINRTRVEGPGTI